jgi:hypothetical protein
LRAPFFDTLTLNSPDLAMKLAWESSLAAYQLLQNTSKTIAISCTFLLMLMGTKQGLAII